MYGGILGGISGLISGLQKHDYYLKATYGIEENLTYDASGKIEATLENAEKLKKAAFGEVDGLRDLKVDEAPPKGIYNPEKGYKVKGKWGHALTDPLPEVNGVYKADVYIGKGAFKSLKKLFYAMGHNFATYNIIITLELSLPIKNGNSRCFRNGQPGNGSMNMLIALDIRSFNYKQVEHIVK